MLLEENIFFVSDKRIEGQVRWLRKLFTHC